MVGRELHTICPHGEDHQGLARERGERSEIDKHGSGRKLDASKKLTATTMMGKALV